MKRPTTTSPPRAAAFRSSSIALATALLGAASAAQTETIDWTMALGRLGSTRLDEHLVENTLGTVLKYREDHQRVEQHGVAQVVKQAFEKGLPSG